MALLLYYTQKSGKNRHAGEKFSRGLRTGSRVTWLARRGSPDAGRRNQALDRAVALAPNDPEVNYGAGMLYAQLDDTDRALKYWQHALEVHPDYPEALNNLGVLYMRLGKTSDALNLFQKATRAAGDFDQPYLNLARLYVAQGDKDRAREILQQWLARHPDHAMAKSMLEKLGQ